MVGTEAPEGGRRRNDRRLKAKLRGAPVGTAAFMKLDIDSVIDSRKEMPPTETLQGESTVGY